MPKMNALLPRKVTPFQQMHKTTFVYVKVTKTSNGFRNYYSLESKGGTSLTFDATESTEGGGQVSQESTVGFPLPTLFQLL